MAVCPHPPEYLRDFRDWNQNIKAWEVGVECGICDDIVDCYAEPEPDYEYPIPVEAMTRP